MTDRVEWVEIIEPKTQRPMYGNLRTGELAWEPPPSAKVKKRDNNQWWELFDPKTSRFYYYNEMLQKTVWHRPQNCDIIPLAKLQTLKLNTEVRHDRQGTQERSDGDTTGSKQKSQQSSQAEPGTCRVAQNGEDRMPKTLPKHTSCSAEPSCERGISPTQNSLPRHRHKQQHRHHHHHHHHRRREPGERDGAATLERMETTEVSTPRTRKRMEHMDRQVVNASPIELVHNQPHSASMHSITQGSPRTKRSNRYTPESIQRQHASYEYQQRRMRSDSAPVDPSQMVYDPHRRRSSMESPQFGMERVHQHGEMKKELSTSSLQHASGPRYVMERSDSAASHSSQSEGYGYGGASPLQFMYAQPAGYMHKHYHERSDSQLSGSSQHSHGDQQPDVLPANRPVHDDPRKQAMPSPRVKKKSKMPKMGINAAMHHRHMQAGQPVQSSSPPVSIPQSQSGERFHQFFPQGAHPPPPSSVSSHSMDFHSAVPAAISAVAQHSVHYHVHPAGYDPNNIPSEHIYEILSPDSPTSQDESFSGSPSHHSDSPQVEGNHRDSDSQLSHEASQASQHSLSSQHSDSSLRPNTSDSQRSQSSDDMQLHGNLSRSADQLLPFEKKQTDIRVAKHRQLDDAQIFNVTQEDVIKDISKKQRKFDGPALYENLDFMAKKKREQEQWKKLRDLDDKDKEISGSPIIPQRHRRPRSGSPRSGSPTWRARMVNGEKDEEKSLGDKKSSEEQLDKSFDSDDIGTDGTSQNPSLYESSTTDTPGSPPEIHHTQSVDTIPMETMHASLRRPNKKDTNGTGTIPPPLERSTSVQDQRPSSMVISTSNSPTEEEWKAKHGTVPGAMRPSPSLVAMGKSKKPSSSESDLENYAAENINRHKKGLFRKKVPLANMLSWTREIIKKPMLQTKDKGVKRDAIEVFKLIQCYMGDRQIKDKEPEAVVVDLVTRGWTTVPIRDELYIQVCRQTTENYNDESLQAGWELLAIFLNFFPPSVRFHSYLDGYVVKHLTGEYDTRKVPVKDYAEHCFKKLERISQTGARKGVKKITLEEINLAKNSVFHPSMFGNTLEDVMDLQKDRFPDRELPWIVVVLAEEVFRLGGEKTEGIFRVPGDIDEVNALKVKCDQWSMPECSDPNVPASLLKLWYRDLYEPLIPMEFYDQCIRACNERDKALEVISLLPDLNRLLLCHFIKFLQVFAKEENVSSTKMDINNLAMVMAPNCLRCASENPQIIFENTRKEMSFVRTLIQHLDTSYLDGII
ncbi:uncharacterized protein [Amphiura filiformis]|uniref:uncharacterized protein n=1 Tax=Amphiura filiformis TaxID=82378 RepID=UPI003B212FB8